MKATRSTFLLLAAVVTALAAWTYWPPTEPGSQGGSKPAAPVSGVPPERSATVRPEATQPHWDKVSATLDRRANGEDVATRFEQSRRCYFAHNKAAALKSAIQSCRSLPQNGSDLAQVASCSANLEKNESALQDMNQDLAECPSDVASASHFYKATKAAASQGDADAQACYVQFLFQSNGTALTYSQQEIDDYRRDAPRYISDGLVRGDWRIVSLLARGGHDDNYSPLPLVTKDNVYTQYVMNRLLQLGAEEAYAQDLERSIWMSYLSPGITTPPPLTQQQIAEGIGEAQAIYHKSFAHKPLLKKPPIACSGD